jgi:predicted O-methyltransferase YrrM
MLTKTRKAMQFAEFAAAEGWEAVRGKPNRGAEIYKSVWYAQRSRLARASLEDLFPGIENVEVTLIAPLREVGGNVWVNELVVLAGICRWLKPKEVFEIGTFNGRTTVNLAASCPADTIVHTLDIPHDHPQFAQVEGEERFQLRQNAGALYRNSPYAPKIHQLWADSAEFDEHPLHGQIDLAFIDGSHSYDYVKNDTEKVMRMMAPHGIILWHDYHPQYPDVARYLEESPLNRYHIQTTSLVVLLKSGRGVR